MKRAIALVGGVALIPFGLFTLLFWAAALFGTESAKMAAEGNALYWYGTLTAYYWPVWLTWLVLTCTGFAVFKYFSLGSDDGIDVTTV